MGRKANQVYLNSIFLKNHHLMKIGSPQSPQILSFSKSEQSYMESERYMIPEIQVITHSTLKKDKIFRIRNENLQTRLVCL